MDAQDEEAEVEGSGEGAAPAISEEKVTPEAAAATTEAAAASTEGTAATTEAA